MVTHNPAIARLGHRVVEMSDGRLLREEITAEATGAAGTGACRRPPSAG